MTALTARHHPRSQDVGTCSAWCDRPAEHEGDCMTDDGGRAADRCPACGLRPTWVNERLCSECVDAAHEAWLDGATPSRPEGSTVDPRSGLLWAS